MPYNLELLEQHKNYYNSSCRRRNLQQHYTYPPLDPPGPRAAAHCFTFYSSRLHAAHFALAKAYAKPKCPARRAFEPSLSFTAGTSDRAIAPDRSHTSSSRRTQVIGTTDWLLQTTWPSSTWQKTSCQATQEAPRVRPEPMPRASHAPQSMRPNHCTHTQTSQLERPTRLLPTYQP